MKFQLIDRIVEIEPGRKVVAEKALSLAEEYLADHFPTFPVLPGVLMVEAMVQAAAWAVRTEYDFRPSIVVLKEARNVTYKSFLAPGCTMRVSAECKEMTEETSVFAARGEVDGSEIVKGKFTLRHLSLADNNDMLRDTDERIRSQMRATYALLTARSAG